MGRVAKAAGTRWALGKDGKETTNEKERCGAGGGDGRGMVGVGGVRPRRGRERGGVASVAVKEAGGMMGEDAWISKTNCRRKVKRDRARARTERDVQQCGGGASILRR